MFVKIFLYQFNFSAGSQLRDHLNWTILSGQGGLIWQNSAKYCKSATYNSAPKMFEITEFLRKKLLNIFIYCSKDLVICNCFW